ncbi:hypothetical protein CITSP_04885 [Citrobacter sp. T1.2D-1]|nr:hypothetical protein CITSP_04885 [Citrobacter sp. T1.2D-1]
MKRVVNNSRNPSAQLLKTSRRLKNCMRKVFSLNYGNYPLIPRLIFILKLNNEG